MLRSPAFTYVVVGLVNIIVAVAVVVVDVINVRNSAHQNVDGSTLVTSPGVGGVQVVFLSRGGC